MPIARIELPDGRVARFEVPDGTSPEDAQAMAEQEMGNIEQNVAGGESSQVGGNEKLIEAGKQASGAAIPGIGMLGGAALGGQIGTMSPIPMVTAPIGAGLGAAYGYWSGEKAKGAMGIQKPEELPEELRPAAYLGESVGGAIPFGAAPMAAARTGYRFAAGKVGGYVNKIIDFAATHPLTYALTEGTSAFSAGLGAAAAESAAPGEAGKRIGAEIAAGMFNPTMHFTNAGGYALSKLNVLREKLTPSGRETHAAKILQDALSAAGEDPALYARILRDQSVLGGTAAQKTGSPTLSALEHSLAQRDQNFKAQALSAREDSETIIENSVRLLRGTGDPEAIKLAAELQADRFRAAISGKLQAAEADAVAAAAKIPHDSPKAKAELSKLIRQNLDDAISKIRKAESELWDAIPKDIPAASSNTLARYGQLREGMLAREPMPQVLEGTIKDLMDVRGKTTSGELIKLRRRALALARESDIQGKPNEARIYGQIAESVLDDLDAMKTNPVFGAYGRHAKGYDDARKFSREFNETFTRTFAGEVTQTGARGRERVPPELLARNMLATGEEAAALKFEEVRSAMRFLTERKLGGEEGLAQTINAQEKLAQTINAQERILRIAADAATDPVTGKVSRKKLETILKNEPAFDFFPEVKNDLMAAAKSQERLDDLTKQLQGASKLADQKATWAKLVKYENPVDAIRDAVSHGAKAPIEELTKMATTATKGGKDATEGLKASIMDHVMRASETTDGVSFAKMSKAMLDPVRPGQPSLADIMMQKGVMSKAEIDNFKNFMSHAERIESTIKQKGVFDAVDHFGIVADLVSRYVGAKVATGVSKATGGSTVPSLQIASGGAKLAKMLGINIPENALKDVFAKASLDPQLMAMLIEKPVTQKAKFELGRRLHAYMWQAGLIQAPEAVEQQFADRRKPQTDRRKGFFGQYNVPSPLER